MRTRPTVSEGVERPRDAGPHGKTLVMKALKQPEATYVKQFLTEDAKIKRLGSVMFRKVGDWSPHTNPERDRSLPGKARRRARKAVA